jgi:hypothetical protein
MIEWKQIACVIDREGGGWAKYERYVDGVREEKEEPWGSPPREGERMSEMEKVPMIEELKALLTAATPTPWQWGVHSEPTLTELGDYAKTMMEKRDGLTCHMAFISDPEDADNEGKYLTTAVVGNGPTSEANAKLIVWAVNALPHLLAELDALRAERTLGERVTALLSNEHVGKIVKGVMTSKVVIYLHEPDRVVMGDNLKSAVEAAESKLGTREDGR